MTNEKENSTQETVVILHGIGQTKWNMIWLEIFLRKNKYKILNITYPSLTKNLAKLARFIDNHLEKEGTWATSDRVSFVTHSMGGLVAQQYLEEYKRDIPKEKLGRVVMLAPPNQGSEVADLLQDFPPYKWIFGPAGQELTTTRRSTVNFEPYYELGIIAGTKGWPYMLSWIVMRTQHDGRVTVARTKLNGMTDHIIVNATHSFISWRLDVQDQILHFLLCGKFRQ